MSRAPWLSLALLLVTQALFGQNPMDPNRSIEGVIVGLDHEPVTGARVTTVSLTQKSTTVKANGNGTFLVPPAMYSDGWGGHLLILADTDDGRLGYRLVKQQPTETIRVVVKPPHKISIAVVDGQSRPISDAVVSLHSMYHLLQRGTTDNDGKLVLQAASDSLDWTIVAYKPGTGFDYAVSTSALALENKSRPLPNKLTLTLEGTSTLRFNAVNHLNQPVAGVQLVPSSLRKSGYSTTVGLNEEMVPFVVTNEAGNANLTYLPALFDGSLAITPKAMGYYLPERSILTVQGRFQEALPIKLLPIQALAGRVTRNDGRPAANAIVIAKGKGTGQNNFIGTVRTNADGRYKMDVYSEQHYLLQAQIDDLISPLAHAIVRAGKSCTDVDLSVIPATYVRGRITVGREMAPASVTDISATCTSGVISNDLPHRDRLNGDVAIKWSVTAKSNLQGEYEFRLAPGEYLIHGVPRAAPSRIIIPSRLPSVEMRHDIQQLRQEVSKLTAMVIDDAEHPVSEALVLGQYASSRARHMFHAKTNEHGSIIVERLADPLLLYARSSNGELAGIIRVGSEASDVQIRMQPVTAASGKLLDTKGDALARREVSYGIRIPIDGENSYLESLGGTATTNDRGEFALKGLVIGELYHLSARISPSVMQTLTSFKVPDRNLLSLADVTFSQKARLDDDSLTPAQRTEAAFANYKSVDPEKRVKEVLEESRRENTRALLLFGEPSNQACIELFRLLHGNDREIAKVPDLPTMKELRWEFELEAIDQSLEANARFASEHKLNIDPNRPLIAILDSDGKVVSSKYLELNRQRVDAEKLSEYLNGHKAPRRNAVQLYKASLTRASSEGKNVFIIFSASWCSPCRKLAQAMGPLLPDLERHYAFVKLDISRDQDVDELLDRFPGSRDSGVPYYCVVSSDETLLADSRMSDPKREGKSKNIGLPKTEPEIEYFTLLVKAGAPRVPQQTLLDLKTRLLAP